MRGVKNNMKYKQNSERIEGRIYQHDLAIKTVQNQSSQNFGKEFLLLTKQEFLEKGFLGSGVKHRKTAVKSERSLFTAVNTLPISPVRPSSSLPGINLRPASGICSDQL